MSKRLYAKNCETDSDYARFAKFYIAESYQFDRQLSLLETIGHLMTTLQDSRFMLYENEQGELAAYLQYRYESDGETVFIESAILAEPYRSSWIFYRGFGDWVRKVENDNRGVRLVRFYVLANQTYLNRLYAKFAKYVGEREGGTGREVVYETAFADLWAYLKAGERK
jgi:hypothetical protein